ncbi:MAG TPA: hypothetical protein VHY35_03475 [Stellaceae bacterium]|nr:hypothetical protein [Stellaceae bacterium]
MDISITTVVITVAVAITVIVLIVAWRRQYHNLLSVLLFASIAAGAIAVTAFQVDQYWQERASDRRVTQSQAPAVLPTGQQVAPPPRAPVILPEPPPMMRGPTGGAAPAVARNPYGRS